MFCLCGCKQEPYKDTILPKTDSSRFIQNDNSLVFPAGTTTLEVLNCLLETFKNYGEYEISGSYTNAEEDENIRKLQIFHNDTDQSRIWVIRLETNTVIKYINNNPEKHIYKFLFFYYHKSYNSTLWHNDTLSGQLTIKL